MAEAEAAVSFRRRTTGDCCTRCGAYVWRVLGPDERIMALDAAPNPGSGRVVVHRGPPPWAEALDADEAKARRDNGQTLYTPHRCG